MIQIDKLIDDSEEDAETNHLMPKHPFRLVISGESGCGKTNLLLNMIIKYLSFDSLFVCAKDLQEKSYQELKEYYELLNDKTIIQAVKKIPNVERNLNKQTEFCDNLDDMKNVDELDDNTRNLIIFDDCITEKNQELIEEMFTRGRKKNASVVYITQSFYRVPKIIRDNSNYFIFYKLHLRNLKRILKEIDGYEIPDFELNPFDFFMLDRKNPKLKFRKNFDPINF
jgi:hypothetical protein